MRGLLVTKQNSGAIERSITTIPESDLPPGESCCAFNTRR